MLKCFTTSTTSDSWLRMSFFFHKSQAIDVAVSRFYENEPTKCEHYEQPSVGCSVVWNLSHSVCEWMRELVCVCMHMYVCFVSKCARLFWRHPFLVHISFSYAVGCRFCSKIKKGKKYRFICIKYKHTTFA